MKLLRHTFPVIPWIPFLVSSLFSSALHGTPPQLSPQETFFASQVYPLLADKCFPCHGNDPDNIEGSLRLTSREDIIRGGESKRPALVPGDPEASLILMAVRRADPDLAMPPKENDRLSTLQQGILERWVQEGAPWVDEESRLLFLKSGSGSLQVKTSGGLSADWTYRAYSSENLWAYLPLSTPTPPPTPISNSVAESNPLDVFLNDSLSSRKLVPAPLADRETLLRRATFDLTGLPPTAAELVDFLKDPSDDLSAFEKVLKRLLESPHYGEHYAQHWLDVVRYADSSGFANDYERGNAWRYRDYVIRSIQNDKPFALFVQEQIAGDELHPHPPQSPEAIEGTVATGFLRMGPWELTGMEVARIARQRFLDDVTDAVGQTFLAHPLQCARCHDHKFDPIPTRDYYRFQSVFLTTQLSERETPFLPQENVSGFEEERFLLEREETFKAWLKQLSEKEKSAGRAWAEERGYPYIPRSEGLKQGVPEERLPPKHVGFSVEDYGLERIARKGLERLAWEKDRYRPISFSVYSGLTPTLRGVSSPQSYPEDLSKGTLEEGHILAGGDPFSPTLPVTPGALSVLKHFNPDLPQTEFPKTLTGRRLALARWISHPANPLPSRVMVNRIWQWHFGRGIAANANNFGAMGGKPTHPELLDFLAQEFLRTNGSWKHLHRLIMTSEAYRRSGHHPNPKSLAINDPDHSSYARFLPRSLSAPEIRDALLFHSGELNAQVGGIPVRHEMDLEVALQPRMVMGTFASAWQPSISPHERHRRSIYTLKTRGLRDPFLEVFNDPSPDLSCERRETSIITPQVFQLLNNPFMYQRAVAIALRFHQHQSSRESIVQALVLSLFARPATREEIDQLTHHWEVMAERHRHLLLQPLEYPKEIERNAVEENTGEPFRFTEKLEFYESFIPDPYLTDVPPDLRGLAEVCLVLFNTNEFFYLY